MEYTSEFDTANELCVITVTGRVVRPRDSILLQQFARDFEQARRCYKFLFDMRQAEIIGGTMDTFEAGTVPADRDRLVRPQYSIALLYSGDLFNHKFMEAVAVNRGYNLRVFDDIDNAMEWLEMN